MTSFAEALQTASYVAFGGCAAKGVCYIGCLKALQQRPCHSAWHRQQFRGACATSSGCIAALALLVNADAEDLLQRWRTLNIESFAPHMDLNGIFSRYGVDAGENVRRVIREVLSVCGLAHDTTFRTLHRLTQRELRICATNLNRMRLEVFSHVNTPEVLVADSIYLSMCVPFVFQPATHNGDIFIDGCALSYVPYDQWPLEDTVIFHAAGARTGAAVRDVTRRDITDLHSFAVSVLACCARSALRAVEDLSKQYPQRFCRICVEDHALDATLHLSPATLDALVSLGFATMLFRLHPDLTQALQVLLRLGLECHYYCHEKTLE